MKKLFFMLIVLFALYLGIQFMFAIFSKGDTSDYIIVEDNIEFLINENSYFDDGKNYYLYNIKGKDNSFSFQIDYNFDKNSEVLKSIKYFNDNNYECILPIFKNNLIIMDIICNNNGVMNYYYNLKGKNSKLDSFVSNLEQYDISQFTDTSITENIEGITIYKDNLIDKHYIGINNYKGIFDISRNFNSIVYNISLYNKDVYNQKVSSYVNEYFISADYNKEHEFNKFNVINLLKLDTYQIVSDKSISLDSYIQGVVDGKLYIYDKDNKTQYEINIEKETIVSYRGNNLKYYNNGNWTTMTTSEADKELKFIYNINDYTDSNYLRIDKISDEEGFYYLYKKGSKGYDVYRKSIKDDKTLIYLFSTKTIDSIYYIDDYVYFINGNTLQVYNEKFGVRNLVYYKELEFNKNLKFSVYSK